MAEKLRMSTGQARDFDPEPRHGLARRVAFAAAIATAILLVAAIVAFVFRNAIASAAVEAYLESHGVKARVAISQLDFGRATAEATLGVANEFSAQRIEVAYSDFPFATRVRAVRLVTPSLRVAFDGTRFSLGSLQPFVDEQSRQKRTGPMPEIVIEDGKAYVDTLGGPIFVKGSGEWHGARAASFHAVLLPAAVGSRRFSATLTGGMIDVHPAGTMLEARATLAGSFASALPDWRIDGAALTVAFHGLTLGDLIQEVRAQTGQLEFSIVYLALADTTFDKLAGRLDLSGLDGGYANGAINGHVSLHLRATAALTMAEGNALSDLVADLGASANARNGAIDINGQLTSRGALYPNAVTKIAQKLPLNDASLRAGLSRALQTLKLDVPAWRFAQSDGASSLALDSPASLAGANGASLSVASIAAKPIVSVARGSMTGAVAIALHGPALPSLALQASYAGSGVRNLAADWSGEVTLGVFGARGLTFAGSGRATASSGRIAAFLDRCGRFKLASYVSNGRETIARGAGAICDDGSDAIFASGRDGWRMRASWKDVSALLPSAIAKVENAGGQIELDGNAGTVTGAIDVRAARLVDAAPQTRFNPLDATGHFVLADQDWRGSLAVTVGPARRGLGTVQILHSLRDGHGSADIAAPDLAFARGGLQPAALSPLLVALQRANGHAKFSGRVNWTPRGLTSAGQLDIDKLEFLSPLGHATEAGTHLHFTSLLPPRTADNQPVTVALVDWLTPLANSSASITWTGTALHVEQTKTSAARGSVTLAPLTIAFAPGVTTHGEVRLDQIDLATLVAASNLSDKMSAEGRIAGDIPLTFGPEGLRFINGAIRLVGPGRLSIKRSVWGETDATIAANGAMRDLAYQALEHLAVDEMDGKLNSLDNGRLGLLLHIKGRNDPPGETETRVGVLDLLRGHAFDKPLTLPKGTPIELTLDLSLNFDQLLAAYRSAWANAAAEAIVTSK